MTGADWLIGYGSLMDLRSAAGTLGREPQLRPVTVSGWRRDWHHAIPNARLRAYRCRDCDGLPEQVHALDVSPCRSHDLHAAGLTVTDGDLALMDARERSYERVQVQATLPGRSWLYRGLAASRCEDPDRGVIPSRYWTLVCNAARLIGAQTNADTLASPPDRPLRPLNLIRYHDPTPHLAHPCLCSGR